MPPKTILSAVASASALSGIPAYAPAKDMEPSPNSSVYIMHKSYTPLDDAHVDWFHQLLPVFLILGGLALGLGLIFWCLGWLEERSERKKKVQDVEKGEVVESFTAPSIARPAHALYRSDPITPNYSYHWTDLNNHLNDVARLNRGMVG